jgi:hypothetical protein
VCECHKPRSDTNLQGLVLKSLRIQNYREAVISKSQGSPRSGAPLVSKAGMRTPKVFHNPFVVAPVSFPDISLVKLDAVLSK